MKEIAGVRLPDTALCLAATQFAESVSEPYLFHHVMRSYVYADWIGRYGVPFDGPYKSLAEHQGQFITQGG